MLGCLGKLYESIENLSDTYLLHPKHDKEALLKPSTVAAIPGLLLPANVDDDDKESEPSKLYMCPRLCNYYVTQVANTVCPRCEYSMNEAVIYVGQKDAGVTDSVGSGFVKGVVTYMVMDDLVVQPMSAISSITLLNKFNVKEVGALQERVVEVGMEEGIKLLKASLQSNNALTSVFVKNMGA